MIVHRLLDAFFRTLDTVDAARDRIDRALGREPRPDPWAVEWPPVGEGAADEPRTDEPRADLDDDAQRRSSERQSSEPQPSEVETSEPSKKAAEQTPPGDDRKRSVKKVTSPKSNRTGNGGESSASKSSATKSVKKPGRKKKSASSRKGSVDRSGKDLISARADQILAEIEVSKRPVATEDAELSGKKVLARVVWALGEAHAAGVEGGLTTKDISALLSKAAEIEVFATNIGRACRDHKALIDEGAPDGRSKRYLLTAEGRRAAQDVTTA